ncbi:MAG TPA: hypothetical protein VMV18_07105 [bacterium]|nr:hypothetical protein [bacterium]
MKNRLSFLALLLLVGGCGAPTVTDLGGSAGETPTPGDTTPTPSSSATPSSTPSATDGTPTRQACTSNFGSGITGGSGTFGRLDGYLVSIVPPGSTSGCNDDSSHVHLQIQMHGGIYDVAVNVHDNTGGNVLFTESDIADPDGSWSEGWHAGDTLDYVNLGLHASAFTAMSESSLSQKIEAELAQANHVSVFATAYGPAGVHDVHRQSGGNDGAIVIQPLSGTAHVLFFHFADQTF